MPNAYRSCRAVDVRLKLLDECSAMGGSGRRDVPNLTVGAHGLSSGNARGQENAGADQVQIGETRCWLRQL